MLLQIVQEFHHFHQSKPNESMGFLNISHHRKLKAVKSRVIYGDTLIGVVYINVVDACELV